MKISKNEDFYFWYCDWCDTENLLPWVRLQDGTSCGACHRPMTTPHMNRVIVNGAIAAVLC